MALTSLGRPPAPPHPDRALLVLVAAAAVLVQLPIFDRWLALLDEGYILALADEVNRGKVLYRDVHVDGLFPGAVHVLAGWLRLAGTSVWTSRLLVVAEFATFATAVVALARRLLPPGGAVVVALIVLSHRLWAFPAWQVYDAAALATTCATVAAALLAGALAGGGRAATIAAGALIGTAALVEPWRGGAVGAALALSLAVHAVRVGPAHDALGAAARFVLGAALVVLPALAVLAATGALDAAMTAAVGAETTAPAAGPTLLPWVPVLLLAAAALAWMPRRHDRPDAARVVVLAWAGGLFLALGLPHDGARVVAIAPPALVLAAALLYGATALLPRPLGAAARVGAGVATLAFAWWAAGLGMDLRRTFDRPVAAARARVRTDAVVGPLVDDVLAWIARAAPPDAPVPVWPTYPMLGFLAGRETAGGFHVIRPGQPADRDERIVADLDRRRVDAVVYGIADDAPVGRFRDEAPRLYTYLVRQYEIAEVFTRDARGPIFTALRRRPLHPPLGAPILTHLPQRLRLWPFADVLSVPLGLPFSPVVVSTAMPFPFVRPQIEFRYGVNPARWLELPRGPFTFEVWVEGERAWSATIDPTTRLADRRWMPGAVDLSRFAGSELGRFGFRVTAPGLPPSPDDLVGFDNPRITGE